MIKLKIHKFYIYAIEEQRLKEEEERRQREEEERQREEEEKAKLKAEEQARFQEEKSKYIVIEEKQQEYVQKWLQTEKENKEVMRHNGICTCIMIHFLQCNVLQDLYIYMCLDMYTCSGYVHIKQGCSNKNKCICSMYIE